MAKNDFKAFATGKNANVMSQEEWEALPALLSGFTAGKASSAQVNKVIRQASFIAAALAQYTANKSGLDVLDDGDLNGFITKMSSAFGKDYQALDATLTALAGLTTGANKLPYFTGNDTAAQTDLTSVGRDIIGKNTIADILTYLGLGEAAKRDVGTNIGQIPDMSAWTKGGPATGRWRKSPDGLIEQWGGAGISDAYGNAAVTFPIAFTSAPDFVLFGPRNATAPTRMTSIVLNESNLSNTGFTCRCFDQLDGATLPSTSNFYWYCRGY
ncbi:gp53-like domain-containing protein [Escherichia coli]|uniref:gp53-like domain-containing protein n=1 Tax=Escherichia coli TaxID=562 RepID=UPI000BE7A3FB|nr:phage tail protein [Escherichia coli]